MKITIIFALLFIVASIFASDEAVEISEVKAQISKIEGESEEKNTNFQEALDMIKKLQPAEGEENTEQVELLGESLDQLAKQGKDGETINNVAAVFDVVNKEDVNSTFMGKVINVLGDSDATLDSEEAREQGNEMVNLMQQKLKQDLLANNETLTEAEIEELRESAKAVEQNIEKGMLNKPIDGDFEHEVFEDDETAITRTTLDAENFDSSFDSILSENEETVGVKMEMSDEVKEQIKERIEAKVGGNSNQKILITQQMSNSSISSEIDSSSTKVSETYEFKITTMNDSGEVEDVDLSGLEEGVKIRIKMKDNVNIEDFDKENFECKYFDEETNEWVTDEDLTLESIDKDEAVCSTTHFTEFTVTTTSAWNLFAFGLLSFIYFLF